MITALATATPVAHFGPHLGLLFLIPLFWAAVIITIVLLVRGGVRRRWAAYGGPAGGPHRSPEATLAERFANGEVDEEEYRARLGVLRANRGGKR